MHKFINKVDFEAWLSQNYLSNEGLWIIFDKTKQTSTLTSEEALDLALCYGWIDGLIKRIDDQYYQKYFKKRAHRSIWSTKNKKRALELIRLNQMKPCGLHAIEVAKSNGMWDQDNQDPIDYNFDAFLDLIKHIDRVAYENLLKLSKSVQRTYALSYFTLKKPESRKKKAQEITIRLVELHKP